MCPYDVANVSHTHTQVIRCLLIVPFPESSLNDEAGKQFMESYDDYAKRARLMTSVHAMRSKLATTTGGDASNNNYADGGTTTGEESGEREDGQQLNKMASPNPAALAKRKLHPNQKDSQAEKRLKESKKKGLKRL